MDKLVGRLELAFLPWRALIAKLIVWSFVFCVFFGILTVIFYERADVLPICDFIFPKFSILVKDSSNQFCHANNVMWINVIVFFFCYGVTYGIAIPIWVIFSVSRGNWSDWRFKRISILFIGMGFLCASLEVYSYLFGSPGYFGIYPKLNNQINLYDYVKFQVSALMGIANFLLFAGTIMLSGKIFGRGPNWSVTLP